MTFIVINLELLPYNSSTLLTLRNTIQAAAWTSVWMETPKTIHFMVLWRPRSLLSSAALWRPNYSQKNLHWQTFYFSRFHIVWKCFILYRCIWGENGLAIKQESISWKLWLFFFIFCVQCHETIYCRPLRATRISAVLIPDNVDITLDREIFRCLLQN